MSSSSSSNPELQRVLDELHPFHFALDGEARIARHGRLLGLVLGGRAEGRAFHEVFDVTDPRDFSLSAPWDEHEEIFLRGIDSSLTLRGRCLTLAGLRHFVGEPWFTIEGTRDEGLSPVLAMAHERWGDHLMALQLLDQQRKDIQAFRAVLSRRSLERDALQRHLEGEKTRLQTVLAAATDAIVTADATGVIVSANAAASRLFGYPTEEIVGRNLTLLMPREIAREHDAHIRRYLDTRVPHVIGIGREVTARRKDGTSFPCELSVGEMRIGDAVLFTGILRDISIRKRAQARQAEALADLQKSHDDLLRILSQLRHGALTVDARGTVTFANEAPYFASPGRPGAGWDEVLRLDDRVRARVRSMMERPEGERNRLAMELASGRDRHWVELEIRDDPRDAEGRIFFFYDVTDLRKVQRELAEQRTGRMVGDSIPMRELYATIGKVAKGEWTVLIEGETGTGKELVAQAIHHASDRHGGPFIAANCAGLTESILGSQLFGHVRGAFTGAVSDREGLFEAAAGGTLFLDEIGDISAPVQAALLRALEEKEITRVGETRPRKVDVRIVAATHRDLQQLVQEGKFREDLLYRLRGARVRVPPLRDRREDIPMLAAAFLAEERVTAGKLVVEVSPEAMRRLAQHAWPGNVRELRGAIQHAVLHCEGGRIVAEDLPPEVREPAPAVADTHGAPERDRILAALTRAGGNRVLAARILGIGRATLYRRLRDLGITAEEAEGRHSG